MKTPDPRGIEARLKEELGSEPYAVKHTGGMASITVLTTRDVSEAGRAGIQAAAIWEFGPCEVHYSVVDAAAIEAELAQGIAEGVTQQ